MERNRFQFVSPAGLVGEVDDGVRIEDTELVNGQWLIAGSAGGAPREAT